METVCVLAQNGGRFDTKRNAFWHKMENVLAQNGMRCMHNGGSCRVNELGWNQEERTWGVMKSETYLKDADKYCIFHFRRINKL
jgi:hypothetical protein